MSGLHGNQLACGNTAYERKESDFYPTPPDVTLALLHHLQLPKETVIWEPACGEGHMANVFVEQGYLTSATDLNYQGYGEGGIDFLTAPLPDCNWIITNPPFNQAENFIRRCAEHKKPFALLLKSQYWHSKSRLQLFRGIQPTEVLPLTWRPDFLFKTRGNGQPVMECLWCVWNGQAEVTYYHPLERPMNIADHSEQFSLFVNEGDK
ncbi:MAG: SAM-dependent DNA methyltransferase [Oscillospiraceae bacterium]